MGRQENLEGISRSASVPDVNDVKYLFKDCGVRYICLGIWRLQIGNRRSPNAT